MSIQQRGNKWRVRWRGKGKHHSREFTTLEHAQRFEKKIKGRQEVARGIRVLQTWDDSELGEQVYVIAGAGMVKVGVSYDPRARLMNLQTGSPAPLELIWRIACNDALRLERLLHERYAEHRSHGEWFHAAPVLADLEALAELGAYRFEAPKLHTHSLPNLSVVPDEEEAESA